MGSLPLIEGVWLTPSSTSSSYSLNPSSISATFTLTSALPPSPLAAFAQRSVNRSPVESPPVQKKALMRVASSSPPQQNCGISERFFGRSNKEFDDFIGTLSRRQNSGTLPHHRQAEGKENKSILKGGVTSSSGKDPNGTLKGRRRVDFEPNVQVFHFDKVAGEHVGSENQVLTVEPKDRREFVNRTIQNKFRLVDVPSLVPSSAAVSHGGHIFTTDLTQAKAGTKGEPRLQYSPALNLTDQSSSTGFKLLPRPLAPAQMISTAEGYIPGAVDFNFFEDESRRLRIKFTIPLGDGVSAADVLVKANMTGNKVRVVASRTVSGHDGGVQREEFSERYLLPMEVDPYLITARLDGQGNLFVEAPIMTAERKKALAAEKLAKASGQSGSVQGFSL